MNFFEHQDQAHRNTKKLIVLFAAAVACLIAMTTALVAAFIYYFQHHNNQRFESYNAVEPGSFPLLQVITWDLLGMVTLVVVGVVLLGSLYKTRELSRGGAYVAEQLGGQRILPNTNNPMEKRVLNVVEEMAIASGTPIPAVYLLEEQSINAFAAGTAPENAAIGVTRGCAELLSRDELQGVMAHEFSHILHGDMRLNMRLIGILHGILLIGLIGRAINPGRSRSGFRRSNSKGSGQVAILSLGLMAIGYGGTFFGKLIKSAVSRQREFLADAAAVQFTRNPQGISGALQKIGGLIHRSLIPHHNSEQFSHLFFGSALKSKLGSLGATHPPLEERIQRIDPKWHGEFPSVAAAAFQSGASNEVTSNLVDAEYGGAATPSAGRGPSSPQEDQVALADALAIIGEPTPEKLETAQQLLAGIPAALEQAAREPYSARALVYGLLIREQQDADGCWELLKRDAHPITFKYCQEVYPQIESLPPTAKLPLFELCLPALGLMSGPQMEVFNKNVQALIRHDKRFSLFEWSLYRLLQNRLTPIRVKAQKNLTLKMMAPVCQQLLSTVAHCNDNHAEAQVAFTSGMAELGLADRELLPKERISIRLLDSSIRQLQQLPPLKKPAVLKAIAITIQADQEVTATEQEIFRAIADCLDCPVPPLSQ